MNRLLRAATISSTLALAAFTARAAEPGYVDLGKFTPTDGCQFVEVNVHSSLLKLAALFADHDNHDAAELIRNLKHVRVNVIGYNDRTRADLAQRVQDIRRDLVAQGWTQAVTVREANQDQDVAIYVKTRDDDTVEGLLVTVMDPTEKQAVLVNVVGAIKPEQVAALGRGLHIEPLADLNLAPAKKNS